jgi:hypothetical protein
VAPTRFEICLLALLRPSARSLPDILRELYGLNRSEIRLALF